MSEQRSSLIPTLNASSDSRLSPASALPRHPSAQGRQAVQISSAGSGEVARDAARDAVSRRLSGGSSPAGSPAQSTNGRPQPPSALRRSFIPSPSAVSLQARRSLTASRGSGLLEALSAEHSSLQRSQTPPCLPSNSPVSILDSPSLMHRSQSQQQASSLSRQPSISFSQSTANLQEAHDLDCSSASLSKGAQSTNIVVSVRLRPLSDKERVRGDHEAWSVDDKNNIGLWKAGKWEPKFHFDHVFGPQARNHDLFDSLVRPLIAPALQGFSSTVFAYGVTSSGKTHTMMGTAPIEGPTVTRGSVSGVGEAGLVPLTVHELFSLVDSANIAATEAAPGTSVTSYTVKLSMMEIYNEVLNDLLDPSLSNLKLREDANKGVVVENLCEAVVQSAEQALACMARGDMYRKTSCTAYNDDSSRSHTICRLTVEGTQRVAGAPHPPSPGQGGKGPARGAAAGRVTTAVLSLIDLAGSESAKVSVSKGQRMEGAFINKSLLTLGTVINKLAVTQGKSGAAAHIPFRDSKLTRLLQNSMTGTGARIAVVCNITPAAAQLEETANTLKFASRAKLVRLTVAAHETVDLRTLLRQYRHEVKLLRAQLTALTDSASHTLPDPSSGLIPLPCMPTELSGPPQLDPHSPSELDTSHPVLYNTENSNTESIGINSGVDKGTADGEVRSSNHVQMLQKELASAMSMLKVEREARVYAEQQVEQLERRLHGMTRLLETRTQGAVGTRGAANRLMRSSDKGDMSRSCKTPPTSHSQPSKRTGAHTITTTQDVSRPHTPAAIPSSPARSTARVSSARSAPAADKLSVVLPQSARASENGLVSPRGGLDSGSSLGRSSGTLSLIGESAPRMESSGGSGASEAGSVTSPTARKGVATSASASALLGEQAAITHTPSAGALSARRLNPAWSDSGSLPTPTGDQSPISMYAPTESSLYDTESDAALLEQIQGVQEELLSGGVPMSGRPHHLSGGGSTGLPTFLPSGHAPRLPAASSNGGAGGGYAARSEVTNTGCSGSVMGDGDKDLEIQVLLADREVLQDQVLAVEMDNERLLTDNEILSAEADRLRVEHEKAVRVNKELESDMAAMREFKNQMAAELEAIRQQVQSALQLHAPPATADTSVAPRPTGIPSVAYAQTGIPGPPTQPSGPGSKTGSDTTAVSSRLQALEAQAQSVLQKMLSKK